MFGKINYTYLDAKMDILPFAKMAVALLEPDEKMDPKALAKFYVKNDGRKTLKRDNPFDLNFNQVNLLLLRIWNWVVWTHRISQANDPDIVKARPLAEISVDHAPCERTAAMNGRVMPASEVPLLPFPECPLDPVFIGLGTIKRKDAVERGLI